MKPKYERIILKISGEALAGENRDAPSVINVSRGILYAEPELTFAQKAQDYANRIADVLG